MKRIFTILLLLFASCENTDIRVCGCEMTFSDALPVQFWLQNCETFNEKEVDGIFPRCFCQPFNSSDEITIQFTDTPGYTRTLVIVNSDNQTLYEVNFTEISSGVYQLSFTPDNIDITDNEIQLLVVNPQDVFRLAAPSTWTNLSSSFDGKTATTFVETITTADNTVSATTPVALPVGTKISFTYTIVVSGTWASAQSRPIFVSFSLLDASDAEIASGVLTNDEKTISANGTYELTEVLEVTSETAKIKLELIEALDSGSASFTLTIPAGEIISADEATMGKSDCLSIKEDHDETILINYTNNRVFASLNSSVGTPDPEFNLRIPAIFFEERYPKESEMMILSNSRSVQLNAQVKKQKWLKVKPMPFYMHLKTQLALVFQQVTIDEEEWLLEEGYDIDPGNPRHPLRKANAWLTQKDYIVRNVL